MEDNVSWPPHSNDRFCIWKHILNHICITEELNRPQNPPNMVLYNGKFSQSYILYERGLTCGAVYPLSYFSSSTPNSTHIFTPTSTPNSTPNSTRISHPPFTPNSSILLLLIQERHLLPLPGSPRPYPPADGHPGHRGQAALRLPVAGKASQ